VHEAGRVSTPAYDEPLRPPRSWAFFPFALGLFAVANVAGIVRSATVVALVLLVVLALGAGFVSMMGRGGVRLQDRVLTAPGLALPLAEVDRVAVIRERAPWKSALRPREGQPAPLVASRPWVQSGVVIDGDRGRVLVGSLHPDRLAAALSHALAGG